MLLFNPFFNCNRFHPDVGPHLGIQVSTLLNMGLGEKMLKIGVQLVLQGLSCRRLDVSEGRGKVSRRSLLPHLPAAAAEGPGRGWHWTV